MCDRWWHSRYAGSPLDLADAGLLCLSSGALTCHRWGYKIADVVKEMVQQVEAHPMIEPYANSSIKETTGFVGNFEIVISHNGNDIPLKHEAVVVVDGTEEAKPTEYL